MNALEALAIAHKDHNKIARPISWRGSAKGICWEESDDKSPKVWRFGWRVAGEVVPFRNTPKKAKTFGTARLPEPEDLFAEWEVIEFAMIRTESECDPLPI